MAEHMIETRILLRYDTFSNWMNSNVILKQGEAAIAVFPLANTISRTDNVPANTPPAVGIKIGDGLHYFDELPWLQAISADVYSWAKSSTKPAYSASEIIGLANYIEQYNSSSTGISASAYRIVYNSSTQKYVLQYQNAETEEWIDTTGEIDFSVVNQRINQLENWANGQTSSGSIGSLEPLVLTVRDEFFTQLNKINYNDSIQPGEFVTSVSQTNGKINVTKTGIKASDITSGIIEVSQGGTGTSSFTDGYALIGGGDGPVKTKEIVSSIYPDSTNALATAGAIVKYINNATAGLSSAMHFIGDATVVINNNSSVDPRIQGYDFSKSQPGDVILYDTKEFVWTGSFWRLLGDEGSYAIKGSITDVDISTDAQIQQSKIANLDTTLLSKVDKVAGKTLTSNDFTDELKQKLETLTENAQENIIEHIFLNDQEITPTVIQTIPKSINLQIKEFDDSSSQKLQSIQAGAQINRIEGILYDGEALTPDENKIISITSNPHTEHENKIESIFINGLEQLPNQQKQVKIIIDEAALNLQVIKGARVPNGGLYEDVDITAEKKLELSRIAKTGNIVDIIQTPYTHVILDCGSSTEVL